MPELDTVDPHRSNAGRRWHPDLIPFKPYVYRGQGFDIFATEGEADDED